MDGGYPTKEREREKMEGISGRCKEYQEPSLLILIHSYLIFTKWAMNRYKKGEKLAILYAAPIHAPISSPSAQYVLNCSTCGVVVI